MNIIISSLDAAPKITETTKASVHNTKIYIVEELVPTLASKRLIFSNGSQDYSCVLIEQPGFDKPNLSLKCYTLQSLEGCIPAGDYECMIENVDTFSVTFTGGLVDEHAPIYIRERTISPITVPIIAGDRKSQQFVFYIQRCYDGISFLDNSKEVYVDYIPVDMSILPLDEKGNPIAYFSSQVTVEDIAPEPEADGRDWIKLIWDLPYAAMRDAGTVSFAISVQGTETSYLWQTAPSTFQVNANLGVRPVDRIDPGEDMSVLDSLKIRVAALENLDADGNPKDENFIFGGGGVENWMITGEQGGNNS